MISSGVLIGALPKCEVLHWQEQAVRDVVCDSRQVHPGDLFVAIPGVAVDGHRFAGQALAAGAVAFVVERPLPELVGPAHGRGPQRPRGLCVSAGRPA